MSSQLHRNELHENRGDLSHADASNYEIPPSQINPEINHDSTNQIKLNGGGTDVMGEPVNPIHGPGYTATSAAISEPHVPANSPRSAESHTPAISQISETHAPSSNTHPAASFSSTSPTSPGNFPTAQPPHSLSTPTHHPEVSQPPTAQAASSDPYVRTSSLPAATGKTPMDSIMQVFNKWSKKAEDMTGNVWNHLRTGPNMADTALGRIAMGTKAMTEGGLENVYRQTFEVAPEEHLLKTYACYLSTSAGPVAGTLYISSLKLAFCSDRPLVIPASPSLADPDNNTTTPPTSSATKTSSTSTANNASSTQQQCYYKVMVPISQVEAVNPSENTQKKPPEKYVQVKTEDGHEFWFMGFVNYDKGVKNLQESLLSKAASPNTNAATHIVN